MDACKLGGALNIPISKLEFTREKSGVISQTYGINSWVRQKPPKFTGLVLSRRSSSSLTVNCSSPVETETASDIEDDLEGKKSTTDTSHAIPNAFEVEDFTQNILTVESLVSEICDTASIAEFELKYGGFRLYVMRNLAEKSMPSPPPSFPPVVTNTAIDNTNSNGSVSSHSLAISKLSPSVPKQTLREKAADEGLVILQSPRVGLFRRCRTRKGKSAPPACKENQIVKEGQVVGYIEQLGGELPIESNISGEVVKILKEDGDAVGYGEALLTILPSFPGIKKLQ